MELHRRDLYTDRHVHAQRALTVARGRRSLPAAFAVLAFLCGGVTPARAQGSLEVSPLRVELIAAPGSTATQAVSLTNTGKDPVRVRARLSDWDLSRDGAPQFEGVPEGGPFSATEWVRIAPPEQVIEAGKEGTVRFSVSTPATVQPGGYRTAILFEFLPASVDPRARGREVQFRSRIGTLVYVNVGEPPVSIDLTDLQVRRTQEQALVVATLRNTSRRTVRTKGTLTLSDAEGKTVSQGTVPDVPILPESEREVAIEAFTASKPVPAGEYRVEVKLDVGMAALIVGETTIKVAK